MSACRCGAEITWATHAVTGERFPVELRLTATKGPDRYALNARVVHTGAGITREIDAVPIDQLSTLSGSLDHRPRCPRRVP